MSVEIDNYTWLVKMADEDLQWIVACMPTDVRAALRSRPNKAVLAGGFIRACISQEQKSDIDLFVSSTDEAEALVTELSANRETVRTENATTLIGSGLPVQVVHKWTYDTPGEVLRSFDFSIATAGVWFDGALWQGRCHEDFYRDLAAKRLRYTDHGVPGGSLLRVLKFAARGYRIPPYYLARLIAAVVEQDGTDYQGIYQGLREVDPAAVMVDSDDSNPFEATTAPLDDSNPFEDEE